MIARISAGGSAGGGAVTEFVWFSPSKGRTLTTSSKAAPLVEEIDDWMLLSEPPAGG